MDELDYELDVTFDPKLPIATTKNGVQIPIQKNLVTATEVVTQINKSLNTPYTGKDIKKLSLNKAEAAYLSIAERAQDGDISALDFLLDRTVGKVAQQVNNVNVTASLQEFLTSIEKEEQPIDITPITPSPQQHQEELEDVL